MRKVEIVEVGPNKFLVQRYCMMGGVWNTWDGSPVTMTTMADALKFASQWMGR